MDDGDDFAYGWQNGSTSEYSGYHPELSFRLDHRRPQSHRQRGQLAQLDNMIGAVVVLYKYISNPRTG